MEKEQDFNELLQEVQQQFLSYSEESNKRFQELEDLISLAAQKMEILEKRQYGKVLSQETSQNSPRYKLNTPKYDEFPGEDKEDWHSEEIICRALGLEEFFQPKISKEDNYGGAKELECTSDFRITPRKIKSNDKEQDGPIESEEPEFQMPKDWIAFKKLDELRLQPATSFISTCQAANSSKSYHRKSIEMSRNSWDCVHPCGTRLMGAESLQVEPLDAFVFCKDSCKYDPSSENGAQYRAFVNKEDCHDMDIISLLDISTQGTYKPPVENHFWKKFKKGEHSSLLNEIKQIDIRVSIPSLAIVKAATNLNLVILDATPHFLELNDLSRPLNCPFEAGEIEQIQVKEQYPADEEITSRNLTTMREMAEDFLYKTITEEPLIATISYRFGKMSSNFGKENVLIFDPGGQVQNKQSIGIKSKFKDMFRSEVKLEEVVMNISVGEQFRPWKDLSLNIQAMEQLLKGPSQWQRKVFNIEIVNSARPQGLSFQEVSDQFYNIVDEINHQYVYSVGTDSLDNAMRLEDDGVSRKRVLITIFDPGGFSRYFYEASLISGSAGIVYVEELLQDIFNGKELHIKGENIAVQGSSEMNLIQLKRSLEMNDPP